MLTRLSLAEVRIIVPPGREITGFRTGAPPVRNVDIKPTLKWGVWLTPQMPLPKVRGRIPRLLQHLTQHRSVGIQTCRRPNIGRLLMRWTVLAGNRFEPLDFEVCRRCRHAMPCRILPRHYAGTCWRADWSRIRTGECHPSGCQPLNIRCLVQRSFAVQRCVCPAKIVSKYQDDIPCRFNCDCGRYQDDRKCCRQDFS